MILFFFNDTATTEIYTLSLHDALPISRLQPVDDAVQGTAASTPPARRAEQALDPQHEPPRRLECQPFTKELRDRKSTRLNSSHANISYAVFCLKKKKTQATPSTPTTP